MNTRLIDDLRAAAIRHSEMGLNRPAELHSRAADEIERLRGVEDLLAECRDDVCDAWNYAQAEPWRDQEKVRNYYEPLIARIDAAIVASRSTGAADVGEDHE